MTSSLVTATTARTVGGAPGEAASSVTWRSPDRGWRAARRSLRRHRQLHLLVLVPIAYFVIFKYIPMTNAIIAFKDFNVVDGVWGSPWADAPDRSSSRCRTTRRR